MTNNIKSIISGYFDDPNLSDNQKINFSLRYLAKYRSLQISRTLTNSQGFNVQGGPFKGMKFLDEVSEGCYLPKLLGIYESELHPFINYIIKKKPDTIINVGSAEGYYSVGLKRLLPETDVFSYDIDLNAQNKSKILADKNNVEINIGGLFEIDMIKDFVDQNTFLICDIEGDEVDLFKEDKINLLEKVTLCVELHKKNNIHNFNIIPPLFRETHFTDIIIQRGKNSFVVPDEIANLEHLDILLASWEWRSYPTPWLIARPKD